MNTKSHLTRNVALLAAVVLATSTSLNAQVITWVGGTGTWDNTTTANWSPATVPSLAANLVVITQTGVTVDYTATAVSAPGFQTFQLGNTIADGSITTFNLDGTDSLDVGANLNIGSANAGAVVLNLSGSAVLDVNGGGTTRLGNTTGGSFSAVLNQSGGTFNNGGSNFFISTGGTYNLSGGNFTSTSGESLRIRVGGAYNQTGGTATITAPAYVAGNWSLSSGTFNANNIWIDGASGSASWTGGTIPTMTGALQLQIAGASWTQGGGTLVLNRFGGASASTLTLVQSSTVRGYGTISDQRFGISSAGTFQNSGRVIADGGGTNNTLSITNFNQANLTNTTDNTTNNGWFATARGTLVLPTLTVAASASTNWGEAAGDTTIDLVNSLRLTTSAGLASGSTGTLSIALLAPDRTDIATEMTSLSLASGGASVISLWDFNPGTFAFGSGNLAATARFDRVAYDGLFSGSGTLGLYLYDGATWSSVLASSDMANNWITSSALTSFGSGTNAGLLAFTVIPEPSTWLLLTGSLTALVLFRRRRA